MTKEQYKAEAAIIDAAYNLIQTWPPDPTALSAYARSYNELNDRKAADKVTEYNVAMAEYNRLTTVE